uniref:hypothetical protein n=1 Tax=Flavobacterium sp. TaxID=239 RepID=UPI004049725B
MKKILLIVFLSFAYQMNAQDLSCNELISYVIKNGKEIGKVSSTSLITSDWLKEVTAYSIEGQIVVIAAIKTDSIGYSSKKYIFCGIPKSNWESFSSIYNMTKTYGERFHTYIIDYKCLCN